MRDARSAASQLAAVPAIDAVAGHGVRRLARDGSGHQSSFALTHADGNAISIPNLNASNQPVREAEIIGGLSQHLAERYEEFRAGGASLKGAATMIEELLDRAALAELPVEERTDGRLELRPRKRQWAGDLEILARPFRSRIRRMVSARACNTTPTRFEDFVTQTLAPA